MSSRTVHKAPKTPILKPTNPQLKTGPWSAVRSWGIQVFEKVARFLSAVVVDWDQFWFRERSHQDLAWIRLSLGIAASIYALTWLPSLATWTSDDGLLSRGQVEFLIGRGVPETGSEGRVSLLFSFIPASLTSVYVMLTAVISVISALGIGGRVSLLIAWVMLLGVIHRVPMLQGAGDYLISGLFGYLLVCPWNSSCRVSSRVMVEDLRSSWLCNVAFRLLECHVFIWFAASLASSFGEPLWWNGSVPWWLSASGDRSWISMQFWLEHLYIMNLTTYGLLGLQGWILVSMLLPRWRQSGTLAMLLLAAMTLIVANEWIYSLAIVACSTILIPSVRTEEELARVERGATAPF